MSQYNLFHSEIREYNPNVRKRSRDVTKDLEVKNMIDWDELLYFKVGALNKKTASDACIRFEYLIMSDMTVII